MKHEYEFIVQETDLDVFGHVNHAHYLRMYEQARWDWMAGRGYGIEQIRKSQIGPIVLKVNIEYKRELLPREKIRIISECSEKPSRIFHIDQKMINERGEVCSNIRVTAGLMDLRKRKLIQPTPEWLYVLGSDSQADATSP